jgi:hypothetical protein
MSTATTCCVFTQICATIWWWPGVGDVCLTDRAVWEANIYSVTAYAEHILSACLRLEIAHLPRRVQHAAAPPVTAVAALGKHTVLRALVRQAGDGESAGPLLCAFSTQWDRVRIPRLNVDSIVGNIER